MQSPSDAELLAEWTARRSEPAFARLVERYIGLVHSAARRQVSDPHLAEEITQAVFILLARKAGSLARQTVLAGWLCRTAHFAARDALRTERRRQHREQLAATMDTSPDAAWQQLVPLLDEAVAQLRETDRNTIVLRYYEQRSLDEVGTALGIGADAAQKRVARALEKLRDIFTKRGVTLTGAAIAGAVSANAVQAVPVGLAAKISAAAVLAGTTITATTAIVMTTLQRTIIGATVAAAVGTGIYEARQAANARSEVRALKQQQSPLAGQIQQLQQQRDEVSARLVGLEQENERLNRNTIELMRLRSEVSRLRAGRISAEASVSNSATLSESPFVANVRPVESFTAEARTIVRWDHTLVAGGWKLPSGNRVVVFVSPKPGDVASVVTVKATILEYPASLANKLGLEEFSTDGKEAQMWKLLSSDQSDSILKRAADAEGVKASHAAEVSTLTGRQAQIQAVEVKQTPSGEQYHLGPVIDVIPVIGPDGQSVDLVVRVELNLPKSSDGR